MPDLDRAQGAWHLRDQGDRADEAWHGHDHYRTEGEHAEAVAGGGPVDDADAPADEAEVAEVPAEASAGSRPNAAVVLAVGLMLVGLVLLAVAIVGPEDKARVEAAATTTPVVPTMSVPPIGSATTAPVSPLGIGVGVGPEINGRTPLRGFGEVQVTIVSGTGKVCKECLLSAFTAAQRSRGLMQVTDPKLGGYGGMLFQFPTEVSGSFWMRNTPLPLSIAYFDAQGRLVSTSDMQPCGDSTQCPSYPAKGPFAYALEVPQGMLDEVGATGDAHLQIDARGCPKATGGP